MILKKHGQFILSGSQNLSVLKDISESLAGRVAILNLWPFYWNSGSTYCSGSQSESNWQGTRSSSKYCFSLDRSCGVNLSMALYPSFFTEPNKENQWQKKGFFTDTGLSCYLQKISSVDLILELNGILYPIAIRAKINPTPMDVRGFAAFKTCYRFQRRSSCLATTGLHAIFLKIQKVWNVRTTNCLREE